MIPIHLEIYLDAQYADSELEDLLSNRQIVYQSDLKPRKYRKKAIPDIREYLEEKVPGRRKQIDTISKYVDNVRNGDKSPLCLHGSTGCGKTSIITQLLTYMKDYDSQFRTVYINCLNYTNVRGIYTTILEKIFNKSDRRPELALSRIFSSNIQGEEQSQIDEDFKLLIVFDEIDQFFTNKSFIYNFLQWIQTSPFPFGIIMISNMVDFATNVQSKLKSRIKFNSIIFAPYSYEDLIQIVKYKFLATNNKFQNQAIVFLCKKVAGINSDVRLIQKYYSDSMQKFKAQIRKISIADIQTLFQDSQNKGIWKILKPYQFILQILWRSPRRKNINIDIQHYCLGKSMKCYKQNQVLYFLYELQCMGILKISKQLKSCDFYYNSWGINMHNYAYILQASKSKN